MHNYSNPFISKLSLRSSSVTEIRSVLEHVSDKNIDKTIRIFDLKYQKIAKDLVQASHFLFTTAT